MDKTSSTSQYLARQLMDVEAARDPSDGQGGVVTRVTEKLREPLATFMGATGFRLLAARALALAKADVPSLEAACVRPDGSFDGLEPTPKFQNAEAGVVVVAHLLGLLSTFVGEPLTRQLLRDSWPDMPIDETDTRSEG